MNFKITKSYGNYILHADTSDGTYNLWKDGTVHKHDLGLDEVVADRGYVGEGKYQRFGEKNFSLAPGYFRTYKEAESYLEGYMAVQGSLDTEPEHSTKTWAQLRFENFIEDAKEYKKSLDIINDEHREIMLAAYRLLPAPVILTDIGIIPAGTLMAYDDDGQIVPAFTLNEADDWNDIEPMTAEQIKDKFDIELYENNELVDGTDEQSVKEPDKLSLFGHTLPVFDSIQHMIDYENQTGKQF